MLARPKVIAHRVFRDIGQLGDQLMRQRMAFQPQHFHPPLHHWCRVMIPFII
jgi:hypothetical protein